MAKRTIIYQTNDLITSFSTKHPKALIKKVPWVITREMKMSEAMARIFDDGHADLLVLDPKTGGVVGLLSNFDNTTTLSSKKKKEKKNNVLLNLQEQCHQMCEMQCEARGGCRSHGIANYGQGWVCIIQCKDEESSVGNVLDQAQTQTPL
jgi:hypothetical protein